MTKGFFVLILWIVLGFATDYCIAKYYYVENTSMRIEITWLTLGVYASLLHSIFLVFKGKQKNYGILAPSGIVVFLISWQMISSYLVEKNCIISEEKSLKIAITYLNEINYQEKYLKQKAYKLSWCKLGFEYKSPKNFRLIIVSEDGSVRLNE